MFGTAEVPQNLTFADGDNGYSYDDKNGGTYLFFRRDDGTGQADNGENVGTAISAGIVALIGAGGIVIGIIIGMVITNRRRRHNFPSESK